MRDIPSHQGKRICWLILLPLDRKGKQKVKSQRSKVKRKKFKVKKLYLPLGEGGLRGIDHLPLDERNHPMFSSPLMRKITHQTLLPLDGGG
jgi:hypothetical protein